MTAFARASREDGQTLVIGVLFMVALLMFLGLVVDGGMYMKQKRDLQGVADAAALAAAQELPSGQGPARLVAEDYVENRNFEAGGTTELVEFESGGLVRVGTMGTGMTSFGALMGMSDPTIRASAAARLQMMGPTTGMLPMAFMRDTFDVGVNYEVKFDNNATGNRGAISPPLSPPTCYGTSGSDDFRDAIRTSENGGVDACPVDIGDTVPVETGNMSGPSRQGFDDRVSGNGQSFDDVFECPVPRTSAPCSVLDPDSPRLGIVPVVENVNGSNEWPNGTSANIRILSYMLVYVGKEDSAGYPAYTNGGKSAWVTPVQAILPEELTNRYTDFVDYDEGLPSPIVIRLVE